MGRPRSPSRSPAPLAVSYNGSNGSAEPEAKNRNINGDSYGEKSRAFRDSQENQESSENIENSDIVRARTNDKTNDKKAHIGQEEEPRPSFSERASHLSRTPTPLLVKGDRNLRDIDRAPPGDPPQLHVRHRSGLTSAAGDGRGSGHDVARKRSQYFEDAFSARDANTSPAKERVRSEALVLAELRTNVIIGDEFTVITELSASLAVRYRRPLSSVVVTLQHNSCMCFGGSFEPAYVMSIFALPAELQPTTNKRNAALIQRHLEEALGVPAARGFLRFSPVPEASLAYGGKTTAGHVEDLPKYAGAPAAAAAAAAAAGSAVTSPNSCRSTDSSAVADMSDLSGGSRKRKARRKLSVKSLSSFRSQSPPSPTPVSSTIEQQKQQQPQQPQRYPIPPTHLPCIVEQSPKGSPQDKRRAQREKERRDCRDRERADQDAGKEMLPETSPASPSSPSAAWQSSRRAQRTKSFVATLFGRSALKHEVKSQ